MNSTERGRMLRQRRHKQGLCTRCGEPATLKSDGTPSLLCAECSKKKNADRENRRKRDTSLAKAVRGMGISMEDLMTFVSQKETSDAKKCVCDGVCYPEYSFCPWCGRKL